ncbi:MAG TPA: hypothetical protein VH092_09840 [Urbifossiella sp.]|jgi:hypothetical protein|nr:hypothetical protein [Urbifossiella sp.]
MTRPALTLAVLAALAAWAGAQGPAPTAADRLRLHRANRTLLTDLVGGGVRLAGADNPVARAEACQQTARAVGLAVRRAAEARDADRVAELGDHRDALVRDGLVPVLEDATRTIPAASPDAARLRAVRAGAAADLDATEAALPPGDDAPLRALRGRLRELHDRLK